jgi:predicted enzyme related to lactoylglutathione lyase
MSRVVHFEIMAKEPQQAVDFYSKVFGWKFQKWDNPTMDYWMVSTGEEKEPGINGGLGPGDPVKAVVNTIGTADLDGTLKKVVEHGGKVLRPRGAIPGVGWFAAFEDPAGNWFGLMQDDPAAK